MRVLQYPRPVWDQTPEAASNNFSATADPSAVIANCHRCECDEMFPQVMAKVLRVKNTGGNQIDLTNFSGLRARNKAISADYARIYLEPLGESKRLKFSGGAAFGSTHIGYGIDVAANVLEAWGSTQGRNITDLDMPNGTLISEDWSLPTLDLQELVSSVLAGVGYHATLTGLRRLAYGNLAIYMDLGAVLNFCQMHEEKFNYFRDGKVDEFMTCFQAFVDYVKNEHANEHPVYGTDGSFGDSEFIRDGLRALATGNIDGSLQIIDHEQRRILEPFMYQISNSSPIPQKEQLGDDEEFSNFMNALERLDIAGGNTIIAEFNGLSAKFSANEQAHAIKYTVYGPRGSASNLADSQPLMYAFTHGYGMDFTNPEVRIPWFKDVVRHFMKAESNEFSWPIGDEYSFDGQPINPNTDISAILFKDLRTIQARG